VPSLTGCCDRSRIERVLTNLLGNAIKFSPDGGEIVVRVEQDIDDERAWAVLTVVDRGIGIPAADLPHVFERYRRGGNVTGQIAGSGIGLSAAQQIVAQHGGTITVESVEGEGTTVTVKLPLDAPSTEPEPA
jgi:signal transduction histidine kinase